ncbi:unnamed protein product [Agarophyton chilense]
MSSSLSPGWSAHQAPDGRWYYANAATGQTQWHPPTAHGYQPPPPPPPPPSNYPPTSGYPSSYPPANYHASAPVGYPGSSSSHQQHGYSGGHARPHQKPARVHHMPSAAARFVFNQSVEFKIKENVFSFSGDSFSIKRTDTGESVFKIKGNAFSFKDSKSLYDMHGHPIYKMVESIISLRGRMQILDCTKKRPIITLRKKGFIPGFGNNTIAAWRGATDQGPPYMEVKGDIFRKDFTIKEVATGRIIATARRRSFTLSNLLLEKDSYVLRVEPHQDTALIVFFVIAVDEQYRDDGERRGYNSLF